MSKICGIYGFKNIITGKMYIGQSVNIFRRKRAHLYLLQKGIHHSNYFQNSFNKYGEDVFIFGIIEECDKQLLNKREIYWIKYYDTKQNGYNEVIPSINGGKVFTQEDIKKLERNVNIRLYDVETKELRYHFKYYHKCAEFLNISKKRLKRVFELLRSGKINTYKNYIILKQNQTIEEYSKKIEEKLSVQLSKRLIKKELRDNIKQKSKLTQIEFNKLQKDKSLKALQKLRESGKHCIDVYIKETEEYVGRYQLISDFCKKYGFKSKYIIRVLSKGRNYYKGYLIKRV